MGKDSLESGNSSSHHNRSSHAKNEFCSVTVRKSDPKEKAGIRLEQEENGRIRVSNIASNGLFANSEIEIGDIVLSINAKRLVPGEGPEVLVDVIRNATSTVTVVVKKTNGTSSSSSTPRGTEKKTKKSETKEDDNKRNNTTRTDSYYDGMTLLNADGSVSLEAFNSNHEKANSAKNKKVEVMTVTAKKTSPSDTTAGLTFSVENKELIVTKITSDSIFQGTELGIGDRVLSINDMNFRSYVDADYAQTIVKKAKEAVTLIVEKGAAAAGGSSKKKSSSKTKGTKSAKVVSSDSDNDDGDEISPLKNNNTASSGTSKKNKHKKEDEIVITATKSFSTEEPGLDFKINEDTGRVCVHRILDGSMFTNTPLKEGDTVLSINEISFRRGCTDENDAFLACVRATETVSMVVLRDNGPNMEKQEFNLDSSVSNLNWQ